jgi:hypothetical protein
MNILELLRSHQSHARDQTRKCSFQGFNLESIRYMTPPDRSNVSLTNEDLLDRSELAIPRSRRSMTFSSSNYKTKQFYLVSKQFVSPTNIIPLIYQQQILLECLYTNEATAYGTIRVHNRAYDKQVFARLSDDDWTTFNDIRAWHSMNYPHDNTDTFTFEINLKERQTPGRFLFAVYFQAGAEQFWDNNQGKNYCLDIVER